MPKEFDNTNRGVLYGNARRTNDRQPDFTGHINVNGTEYWLSCWNKVSAKGAPYMSLSVREKEEVQREPAKKEPLVKHAAKRNTNTVTDFDDEIPF